MIRRFFVWLLFLLVFVATKAQEQHEGKFSVLNGVVSTPDGIGIGRVICRLETANDSLLSYTLTNNKGEYRLYSNPKAKKITYSFVGYDSATCSISPERYNYDITLYKKTYKLNEVTVTVAPIERRKDTLNYNVGSFIKKGDVYIEDVLKRLPGIEVASNGEITYQGQSINKFNIEGIDLMGDKYNQATRNMPASAVSQIQVMENNQPIRVLDGTIKNNHATLNIRLKKGYKVRPFGEIEGGVGKGENYIWANTATAIRVCPKNQFLITGTMDNRGIGLSALTRDMANNDRLFNNEPLPSSITSEVAYGNVPISPLYYLDNKSYFIGANYLHAFTKSSTIRFNLLYNHEDIFRKDTLCAQYIASDTTSVSQMENANYTSDITKAQMRYELNNSDAYIEEILTGEMDWRRSNSIISANAGGIKQKTNCHPATFKNSLNGHINLGGQILSFSSVVRFFKSKESLNMLYGKDDKEKQQTCLLSWFMRHRIMYSFRLWGNTLNLAYILENKNNCLRKISAAIDDKSHYWLHTLEPTYTLSFNKGELALNFPLEAIVYTIKNKSYHQYLIAPSIDFNLKLTPSLTGELSLGYNQDVNTNDINYSGILYNNYRTQTMGTDSLTRCNTTTADVKFSYLNTLNMLSMNLFLCWTKQNHNYMQDMLFTDFFTFVKPLWMNNTHTSYSASYNIKKAFRQIGLELNYTFRYALNEKVVSQNNIIDKIKYQAISNTIKAEWNKLSWMHMTVAGGHNFHWKAYDKFSASHNYLRDYEYMVKMDFFPCNHLHVYIDYSRINHEISAGDYSIAKFVNCGVNWNINKRLSIKGNIINLLDTKEYKESYFEGSNYTYYAVPLRGREMMLALNYSF